MRITFLGWLVMIVVALSAFLLGQKLGQQSKPDQSDN